MALGREKNCSLPNGLDFGPQKNVIFLSATPKNLTSFQ